ncbi:MAG: hypothetical protein FWD87_05730 [Spirochaetaceae bacterium]|nr:hypothetical protein [Spirochaetaceae bacterium]
MKKVLFLLIILTVVAGGAFAQQHYVSGDLILLGLGARYEFQLTPSFSVGALTYVSGGLFSTSYGVYGTGYFYPWGRDPFYVALHAGFRTRTFFPDTSWETNFSGFMLAPEVGWRIDAGNPGGFFVRPGIRIPLHFVGAQEVTTDAGGTEKVNAVVPGFVLFVSLGMMF